MLVLFVNFGLLLIACISHYFYLYDPSAKGFMQCDLFCAAWLERMEGLDMMVPVINYLLSAYLDSLIEYVAHSAKVGENAMGDGTPITRPSLAQWPTTEKLLLEARDLLHFRKNEKVTVDKINERGERGIQILQDAVETLHTLEISHDEQPEHGLGNDDDLAAKIDRASEMVEIEFIMAWNHRAAQANRRRNQQKKPHTSCVMF
ncbi:hypothetical protein B0H14DRAFT_2716286 [Mycena olivaceomarginata]|nr:hypothetical protein B0H14DRAFT_2716286 [Mycena olivaceomarginata]